MFPTDAGRTAGTRPLRCHGVALGPRTAKAPARGLSALTSMAFGLAVSASQRGLPRSTQDSLPAAGQALPGGLSTRKVPLKGFWLASYMSSSLPKLAWRNRGKPERAKHPPSERVRRRHNLPNRNSDGRSQLCRPAVFDGCRIVGTALPRYADGS